MTGDLAALEAKADLLDAGGVNEAYAPLYAKYGLASPILASHAALLYERRRYADAENLISAAMARGVKPGAAALNSAGLSAYAAGSEERAEMFFAAALQAEPANAKALNNLAALRLSQGRPAEALPFLRAVNVTAGTDKEAAERAVYNKAMALAMLGEEQEARRLLLTVTTEERADRNLRYFAELAASEGGGPPPFAEDGVSPLSEMPGRGPGDDLSAEAAPPEPSADVTEYKP